jgi:chromosomal replication initiator protein
LEYSIFWRGEMDWVSESPTFSLILNRLDSLHRSRETRASADTPEFGCFVGDQANIGLKFLEQLSNCGPHVWPLVLLGSAGTGKTSLASQLANRLAVENDRPELILSTADFCRRFANAVETNCTDQFRQSILDSGCFVLDDLEQFKGHAAAEMELASLLDRFRLLEKPFIATAEEGCFLADRLSPRLCSRLTAGLCLLVNPPGHEARRILIGQSAADFGFDISPETSEYLATELAVTYPRIRQFFVRLNTWLLSTGRQRQKCIDRKLINEFLSPDHDNDGKHSPDSIIRLVANRFKVKVTDMKSNSRRQTIVFARGVAVYLLRRQFRMSFARIGDIFGGRDHSTIMHSNSRIEKLMKDQNHQLRKIVGDIEKTIRENALLSVIE